MPRTWTVLNRCLSILTGIRNKYSPLKNCSKYSVPAFSANFCGLRLLVWQADLELSLKIPPNTGKVTLYLPLKVMCKF